MVVLKTYYLRVSVKEVFLVEIHGIDNDSTNSTENSWLQERHLQEIIQLLHPTVSQYLASEQEKKPTTSGKQLQQKPSDILTGSTVRFGFAFKTRPGRQTCLFEDYSSNGESQLNSFHVMKEKITVYAHPLIPGSPTGMSQLMKALKRKSIGQGVSISSYFKKLPSQTVSQPQSDSQSVSCESQETQSTISLNTCETQSIDSQTSTEKQNDVAEVIQLPSSEGCRNKIKSILGRGNIGLTRRKKKNIESSDQEKASDTEIKVEDGIKSEIGRAVNDPTSDLKLENDLLTSSEISVMPCESPILNNSRTTNSFMIGGVRVDQVDSPGLNLGDEQNHEDNTVTLISVNQVKEMKEMFSAERKGQFTPPSHKHVTSYQSDHSSKESQSSSPNENQSEPHSDTSDDISILPSASFCFHSRNKKSNAVNVREMKKYLKASNSGDESKHGLSDCSIVEKEATKSDKHSACEIEGLDLAENTIENAENKTQSHSHSSTVRETVSRKGRLKRKFPKFSDSDLEENLPGKKQRTKTNDDRKFVNLESMNKSTKKMAVSKSFMTGDCGKVQPTLSFFMNKSNSAEKGCDKTEAMPEGSVLKDHDLEGDNAVNTVTKLSENLSEIKDEADLNLKEEINAMTSVNQLNEQHLQYTVRKNESYLRQIFEGKLPCERHMDYKCGGSKKRALNFQSHVRHFREEQIDAVMESLMAIFCKRHTKYLDYLLKVLLPEMLLKLHMDLHGTSRDESEKMMGTSTGQSTSSCSP